MPAKSMKRGDDSIDVDTVEVGHRRIFSRKPTGWHGGKGMVQGIEETHSPKQQQGHLRHGEQRVNFP